MARIDVYRDQSYLGSFSGACSTQRQAWEMDLGALIGLQGSDYCPLTLRLLMSYIYIWSTYS